MKITIALLIALLSAAATIAPFSAQSQASPRSTSPNSTSRSTDPRSTPPRSTDLRQPDSRQPNPRQSGLQDNAGFSTAIEAILHDIPSNLRHITGELVMAEGEIENYACTVELPGAQRCVITRYHSMSDTTANWQAKMYSNEDFAKASRQYHDLYSRLRSCYLLLADSSMIFLKGEWEPAREEIPFATSTLRLSTGDGGYGEVQVQLEMIYQETDWVVNINIFPTPLSLSSY